MQQLGYGLPLCSPQQPFTWTTVCRPFLDSERCALTMRKVLHVGPCDTPGGMATVMHTLAQRPPEGWEAELLASHAPGGLWAKWRAYRRARRELKRRCSNPSLCPDVVHVHAAADWSWRRKARLMRVLQKGTEKGILRIRREQHISPADSSSHCCLNGQAIPACSSTARQKKLRQWVPHPTS